MPDFLNFVGEGTLVVFLGIVIAVLLVAYLGSRYKVAAPNEALIRSGRATPLGGGESGLKVIVGQGVVVLPLFHKIGKLKLTARQINVNLADAVSRQGIKVAVQGVATFKIGRDDESIRNAAERFLESPDEEVDSIVKNVLEGSLRSIVGTLTIEELNLDRQKFQQAVQDAAKGDLATSGLQIDSFTIQAIRDESGYMDLIGQQETARRERDARMAKASADQEAAVREAEAEQIKINAERDVSLRRAETETQIQAADARAAQSGPLAQAEAQQEVTRKQTELAQLEADRVQKNLVASIVRPAEADAEAQIRRAEGDKQARIAAAQADAERVKLAGQAEAFVSVTKGEAQARITEVNAEATAKQTTLEGNAEAGVVLSKGEAEAKALALRAEAYRQFNEAAVIQTVLSMLPEIVRAAAEPMGKIGSLTVLSSDGASELVKTTTRTVAEAGATVKGLTGLDIPAFLGKAMGVAGKDPDDDGGGGGRGGSGGAGGSGGSPAGGGSGRRATKASPSRTSSESSGASGSRPPRGENGQDPAGAPETGSPDSTPDPGAALGQAGAAIEDATRRAAAGTDRVLLDRAVAPPTPSPEITGLHPDSTLDQAIRALAAHLRAIPGIERFGPLRLADLERTGPRPLRVLWRTVRDRVDPQAAELTIGEILQRSTLPPGGPPATHA